jgi:hypothetical protein
LEIGLAIVALAVASAISMLALARLAPRTPPADFAAPLTGRTPAGHPWTLDPDRGRPDRTRWIWRSPMTADEPVAAWRGDRGVWDRAAIDATSRPGDPPPDAHTANGWTLAGKPIQDGILVTSAPAGVEALGWADSGWVVAELPAGVGPAQIVAFAGELADHLFRRGQS